MRTNLDNTSTAAHRPSPMSAPTVPIDAKRAPLVLTHSALKAYRACPRRYEFAYRMNRRARRVAKPLEFGTAVHKGVEVFWLAYAAGAPNAVDLALVAIGRLLTGFDLALARPMMVAYAAIWTSGQEWEVPVVEGVFRMALKHPDGRTHPGFVLEGRLDRVMIGRSDHAVRLTEVKTSSQEVGPGSMYRARLDLDEQLSLYLAGAESLGLRADWVTYDVLRKPRVSPRKATPLGKRVMVKDRATKEMRLKAGQRETDETPEEFEARVAAEIAKDPGRVIVRFRVDRHAEQRRRFHLNVWAQAEHVARDIASGHFYENSDSCHRYGGECEFAAVCLRGASIEDDSLFRKLGTSHPELTDDEEPDEPAEDGAEEAAADW